MLPLIRRTYSYFTEKTDKNLLHKFLVLLKCQLTIKNIGLIIQVLNVGNLIKQFRGWLMSQGHLRG